MDVIAAPWFYWSLGVAAGLPAALIALTEWHNALARRRSHLAGPVNLLRTYLLPLGALWVLLVKSFEVPVDVTSVRIIATLFGFLLLLALLSGLNAILFRGAPEESWRRRLPTILFDVARLVLVGVGLALILSYIWGVKIGGLFAALGVTSVVIGLMLQNSVGQIVSGLFLLFEQPFRIGDWLDTPTARGRVVEVNWRAVHIETGHGLQIMPNSVLAGLSFTNLSRPSETHNLTLQLTFSPADPPDQVCELLTDVAAALPQQQRDGAARGVALGGGSYRITIPLCSPADDGAAQALFLRWLWYAARRAGLRLDGAADDFSTPDRVAQALQTVVAPALRLTEADQQALQPYARLVRYGADELMQGIGDVPGGMTFVVAGGVRLTTADDTGAPVPVAVLDAGAFLGLTTLTRQPNVTAAHALGEVTALEIGRDHIADFVMRKPALLADLGRIIDERRGLATHTGAPERLG
ncbi:mechanosensitive ion channel family protein [Mycolicibacter acidiphilus]|uniref:mechanosensitive ion channel family protein n=1 Tax=Mycolicibacter acidiphilus TaxID=2835306 RepID=UPI0027DD4D6E|nr:mechanosensitive ion channel family protein [Mycolicibacter acidiphilus]